MRTEGCWIFISHSSKDIKKIRMIRNEFERYGQNPLAFHLKCLNTDTKKNKNELLDLIKREIDARDWFVFCESDNSLSSEYVQIEREYVINCNKKMIWKIDLNSSDEEIKNNVRKICCDLQVYISYAHKDKVLVDKIKNNLEQKDYYVWTDMDLNIGVSWEGSLSNILEGIAKRGLVLLILTENSINSNFVKYEINFAKQNGARIIALVLGLDRKISEEFRKLYDVSEIYNVPIIPKDKDMTFINDIINESLIRKLNGTNISMEDIFLIENKLQELLNYNGCYHDEPILVDYDSKMYRYIFPCCGKYVFSKTKIAPSRFRVDGCKIGRGDL